jgi:hypothetical protein
MNENFPFPQNKNRNRKGMIVLDTEKDRGTNLGSAFEGRDKVYMDVDRMINEGMSGGSVHSRSDTTNIEEARDLYKEQPPHEID